MLARTLLALLVGLACLPECTDTTPSIPQAAHAGQDVRPRFDPQADVYNHHSVWRTTGVIAAYSKLDYMGLCAGVG